MFILSPGLSTGGSDRSSISHSGNIILKQSFRTYSSKESIEDPFRITIFFKVDLLLFPALARQSCTTVGVLSWVSCPISLIDCSNSSQVGFLHFIISFQCMKTKSSCILFRLCPLFQLAGGDVPSSDTKGDGHRYRYCAQNQAKGQIDDLVGQTHMTDGYGAGQ